MTRAPDTDLGTVLEALADELADAEQERRRLERRCLKITDPLDRMDALAAMREAAAAERGLLTLLNRLEHDAPEAHTIAVRMLQEQRNVSIEVLKARHG